MYNQNITESKFVFLLSISENFKKYILTKYTRKKKDLFRNQPSLNYADVLGFIGYSFFTT